MRLIKFLIILIFLLVAINTIFSQLEFKVETDKQTYDYGETILIDVTVENTTSMDTFLVFASSCQSGYHIDDYSCMQDRVCASFITEVMVFADSHYTWHTQYPYFHDSEYELSPGNHYIVGEVLGYGTTDSIEIYIYPLSSINQETVPVVDNYLFQNYPNPFNSSTRISFYISEPNTVILEVYNLSGQKIDVLHNGHLETGYHEVIWEIQDLPSGIYFYRIKTKNYELTKKLINQK